MESVGLNANKIIQNETLYVNHLNEKIKTDLLRENLYLFIFSIWRCIRNKHEKK